MPLTKSLISKFSPEQKVLYDKYNCESEKYFTLLRQTIDKKYDEAHKMERIEQFKKMKEAEWLATEAGCFDEHA